MDAKKDLHETKIVSLAVGSSDEDDSLPVDGEEAFLEEAGGNAACDAAVQATDVPKKKRFKFAFTIEFWVAVILALTALGTAWASWMSELHESIQAEAYTVTSARYSEGMSMINAATIDLSNELSVWNTLVLLESERRAYVEDGDLKNAERTNDRIEYIISITVEDKTYAQEIREALRSDEIPGVYDAEAIDAYYDEANEILAEGKEALETGNKANLYADSYGLVRVLYSVVMFLLAAIGIYKEPLPRKIVLCMGALIFVFATIYMFSLPLPKDFSFGTFFAATFNH